MGVNIGDIGKKLGVLKDYTSLVVPVIIVVIALVFLVMSPIFGSKLSKKVEAESLSDAKRIRNLQSDVPAKDQWKIEAQLQAAREQDANEISNLIIETTQRELLRYRLFPEPNDKSTLLFSDFGHLYQNAVETLIEKVNGRDCPTDLEIQQSLGQDTSNSSSTQSYSTGRRGSRFSSGKKNMDSTIIDALCIQRATQANVYVSPWDISGYNFWDNFVYEGWESALTWCWTWQTGYWIIEDVFETVNKCNKNSASVFDSPVKRIIRAGFTTPQNRSSGRSRKVNNSDTTLEEGPAYLLKDEDALSHPLTARKCDDKFDIVHFAFSVIVESDYILKFTQQLCSAKEHTFSGFNGDQPQQTFKHNQITVLDYNVEQIDQRLPEHELYRYGDKPIVRLDLICEYVFVKQGYEPIMPQKVKDEIAGVEEEEEEENMY